MKQKKLTGDIEFDTYNKEEPKTKFLYYAYREWSFRIFDALKEDFHLDLRTKQDYSGLERYKAVLLYGWSWIVPKEIVNNNTCVCLHDSPLPKYRGGSPLQHQIINGETEGAVTLFQMDEGLDTGKIYYQKRISLEGNLSEIFDRIVYAGIEMSRKLLRDFEKDHIVQYEQDNSQATVYKRRKPEESELEISDLEKMTARQIHDKVRALQDPYPNAFIKGVDGKKVYITNTRLED